MSFTYSTLKTAIQDYTENDETGFLRNLPLFIEMTEERILKNVQLTTFQKNASGVLSQNGQFLQAPSDFIAPFSLSMTVNNEKVFLLLTFGATCFPKPRSTGSLAGISLQDLSLCPYSNTRSWIIMKQS